MSGATWGCQGLSVRYGDTVALEDVSLEVPAGAVAAVVGGDGAGKTTLLRALAGTVRPAAGTVRRPDRRRLGYVSAGPGVWADLTVDENLSFAGRAYGLSADDLEVRVGALLDRTGLAEAHDRLAGRLSGGMRQKLALAMAVAHEPDLLVLDEPTSGVDPLQRARLWETIRASAEHGAGVLVTTHHLAEAEQCDRLVVLAGGRVVAAGSLPEIVGDTTAAEVRTPSWEAAFTALDQAGLPVSLVGRTLRVPAADPAEVHRLLAGAGVAAEVALVPASFEETFVVLAA